MHLQCGSTVIGATELHHVIPLLSEKRPKTSLTGFETEFRVTTTQLTGSIRHHNVPALSSDVGVHHSGIDSGGMRRRAST